MSDRSVKLSLVGFFSVFFPFCFPRCSIGVWLFVKVVCRPSVVVAAKCLDVCQRRVTTPGTITFSASPRLHRRMS